MPQKKIIWKYIELFVFFLLIIINLIPVYSCKFFPSLDGASHLYNSNLINQLIFSDNELVHSFFRINNKLVPNWTGHFILSLFNSFLPAYIAEKILLSIYIIGLPVAFRSLTIRISSPSNYLYFLIFPFIYSFIFFLGFYNLCIGMMLLFFIMSYWLKVEGNLNPKSALILFILITLLYFTHPFIFGIFAFIFTLIFIQLFIRDMINGSSRKKITGSYMKKTLLVIFAFSVSMGLFIVYYLSIPSATLNQFIERYELIQWIKIIRPIISLHIQIEGAYTAKLFYLIGALIIIAVFIRIENFRIKVDKWNFSSFYYHFLDKNDIWLLLSMIFLIIYFVSPNATGYVGHLSARIGLIFFLFLIIWISSQKFPQWLNIFAIIFILFINFSLNRFYVRETKELNETVLEYDKASSYVKKNSIVLPVNYSQHWLHLHFSNYLAVDKPLIILNNYEADMEYFPVTWNKQNLPQVQFGNEPLINTCLQWRYSNQTEIKKIDYVLIGGDVTNKQDNCLNEINNILQNNYQLIYSSTKIPLNLYELNYNDKN
ncbi:MAG: hypothetical protein KAT48_04260 [Bacteroidales bacterium]|nr:hypothetical protein [Bacteroidales bacterium]